MTTEVTGTPAPLSTDLIFQAVKLLNATVAITHARANHAPHHRDYERDTIRAIMREICQALNIKASFLVAKIKLEPLTYEDLKEFGLYHRGPCSL